MSTFYFDSSGIVKLYIPEPGSAWVKSLVNARTTKHGWEHEIAFAKVGIVEVAAAMAKRERMRDITLGERDVLVANFLGDCVDRFTKLTVDDEVVELATDLTQRHPLRGYDAVHLATALILNRALVENALLPLTFVAADDALCKAAEKEKLTVENPN